VGKWILLLQDLVPYRCDFDPHFQMHHKTNKNNPRISVDTCFYPIGHLWGILPVIWWERGKHNNQSHLSGGSVGPYYPSSRPVM